MPNGARNWCFTINHHTAETEAHLNSIATKCVYLLYGREVADSGTPHLQGMLRLAKQTSMAAVKRLLGGVAHLTICRNVVASEQYCKKDGDFVEFGQHKASEAGKRSDIEEFKTWIKESQEPVTLKTIREFHSELYAKYPRWIIEYWRDNAPERDIEVHPWRPWQEELNTLLNRTPGDREIIFCVDRKGNGGKTWFAHYYAHLHPENVQVLQPGKKADMCYALSNTIRVLFIDAPRSKQGEFIQYDFLEDVKNGYVFSGKYESYTKTLGKCHVVVMMNEEPDMQKLSEDRYSFIRID